MIADLIPTSPADILAGWKKRAIANNAYQKTDSQIMQGIAADMRKVLNAQCESYKKLVIDTYLDCDADKVKISKRVAKVPKYARGVTK
jgi:uncharacterized protein YcnI